MNRNVTHESAPGTTTQGRRPKAQGGLRYGLSTAANVADRILHVLGRSVFILAPVLMLAVLVIGLGYVRLRHGPISLEFLVAPIERGINAELGGNTADIEDAVVSLTETGGFEFRLRNLSITEPDGDVIASAPFAAVELSTAALWSGRIVPSRVDLIKPRLFVFYSEDQGLSMSFSRTPRIEGDDAAPDETANDGTGDSLVAPTPAPAIRPGPVQEGPLKRIDLARVVTEMSSRARQRLDASSYLKQVGLRDATVVLEYGGRTTEWHVPEIALDLMHASQRSVISGRATIASGASPWKLTFQTDEQEGSGTLNLRTTVSGLVPRHLSPAVPELSLLQAFDMPVAIDSTMQLSRQGDIRSATVDLQIGKGSLRLPALPDTPLEIEDGRFKANYESGTQRVVLLPSTLNWRGSHVTLGGNMAFEDGAQPAWRYQLKALDGEFAAKELGVGSVPLEAWEAEGRILPHRGEIELAEFHLKAGGGSIDMTGDLLAGVEPASTRLEGTISPMPLETFKAIWPKAIAPGAREWIGERVLGGKIDGGTFRFVSGEHFDPRESGQGTSEQRLSMAMEASSLSVSVIDGMPLLAAPRVLMRLENEGLEVSIPEASIILGEGHGVSLKAGRFTAADIMGDRPIGEIVFGTDASLGDVLDVLEQSPLTIVKEAGVSRENLEGKVDGEFKVTLPLVDDLAVSEINVAGTAHITDGRAKDFLGPYNIQGASITFDFTEKAVDATGEMLINGVLAKIGWQRIFDAPYDSQPPLRLTATLDNSDRNHLGLDINHIVQGEVPIELTITPGLKDQPAVHLRADLTNAELVLRNMSWRKPSGRSATLQCDISQDETHKTELQNFKVSGDDVAIEGWAAIGEDNRLQEFYFPHFSLNVVTRMEVQGKLGKDDVWKVKAHGPAFDGREFFRSLFSLGQLAKEGPKPRKPRDGLDLEAKIDTVIGFSEVTLRGVNLRLSKRGDAIESLDVRGTLDGGEPLVAVLRKEKGKPRKLLADSTDAGQAFKLIGFYPNVKGGRVRLEVNLDGKGEAEKTGILWVEDFAILGDPVVSEVFSGANDGRPAIQSGGTGQRRVVREVFEFNKMRVPFSVGYGQFVMEESYLRGPVLGASIRGKVDYKMQRVNLGGTYVPLQGLNSAFCDIPIVGPILTGPKCEGMLGITFAIQGGMNNPQVIVNPFSLVAPGIFRDIFQMTNPNPRVRRRDDAPGAPADQRVRASSTATRGESTTDTRAITDTIDGWSSETTNK